MKNTALIGLGMVGSAYADALHRLSNRVHLKGVFARTKESRTAFLTKFKDKLAPDTRSYASISEIASDHDIEFVILTTPPNARKEIVVELAAAGKHILMEKPVERTVEAALELCEICEKNEVSLGVMLQHRARPSAIKMRELLAEGVLGRLFTVEVSVPWWREQAYYDEPGRGSYERDGGGVMISQAIHTLDLMLELTGPVSKVTAMSGTSGFHKMESENFVTAGLEFRNGALGTLFTTTSSFPGRAESIILNFSHASAVLESNSLTLHRHDGTTETFGASTATGAGADPMAFTSDLHMAVIDDFVQSVKANRAPLITGRSALNVHHLIQGLEKSGKSGSTVNL